MSASDVESLSSRTLISALTDPLSLHGLRRRFAGAQPDMGRLRPLVVELIDPKLLRVALGPKVGPPWASSLQRVYDAMREMQPADFHDVDASWKRQRGYWRSILRSARQTLQAGEEAEADQSAASGAHGAVADVTVGARRAADDGVVGAAASGTARDPGRKRVSRLARFGDAPDPDPDVESLAPPLSDEGDLDPDDEFGDRPPEAGGGARPRAASRLREDEAPGEAPDLVRPGAAAAIGGADRGSQPVVRRSGAPAGGGPAPTAAARARAADPGAAVVQLIAAMLHSPQSVDRLRREWISSRADSTAWDRWALPPSVAEVIRERHR